MVIEARSRLGRISATVGGVVWLLLLFFRTSDSHETELINRILFLGVLVIVPLGLSSVAPRQGDLFDRLHRIYRLAVVAQPFGAIAAIASFFLKAGIVAAALAVLWTIVTAVVALYGLSRLLRRELLIVEEVSISVGLMYLVVGGGWFVMARFGLQPLGFGDTIVLLTAVHFHFAGFAAPILVGLAGRALIGLRLRRVLLLVVIAVAAGTPLVAVGITASSGLAFAGALVISFGLAALAVLVVGWVVPLVRLRGARLLLVVSSASSAAAMSLACAYAYSVVTKTLIINIPRMALSHGLLNAFGFSLAGLISWSLVQSSSPGGSSTARESKR